MSVFCVSRWFVSSEPLTVSGTAELLLRACLAKLRQASRGSLVDGRPERSLGNAHSRRLEQYKRRPFHKPGVFILYSSLGLCMFLHITDSLAFMGLKYCMHARGQCPGPMPGAHARDPCPGPMPGAHARVPWGWLVD